MKVIPLSESQQRLITEIIQGKNVFAQRQNDFVTCILGSNGLTANEVADPQISPDGKALIVELKKKE